MIKHRGSFNHLEQFLNRVRNKEFLNNLDSFGKMGVNALSSATPVDSGKTASCWDYIIEEGVNESTITWINTNENDGVNVVVLLQYGHGLPQGGYVYGIDFVNPAMRPVFENIANEAWKEVRSL